MLFHLIAPLFQMRKYRQSNLCEGPESGKWWNQDLQPSLSDSKVQVPHHITQHITRCSSRMDSNIPSATLRMVMACVIPGWGLWTFEF